VASNLAHLDTGYRPPPSAFSRDPALTPTGNVRDSVSTQQSGASSSLYPPSTSTTGFGSPTSPLSMSDRVDQLILPPVAPEVSDVQEYDSDDVSYRLRLLVNNNYFLPPAHSKPSPEDFASSPSAARKASTPFLDLFRVGKSKSKPPTPTRLSPVFDPAVPMLRATSDSIVAPYALRTQQPRSSSQLPRLSPRLPIASPRGRVVVVREKMNDIAVAAKQAEQDLKTRGVRIEQGSQKAKQEWVDDVIDPTDAVDIPLLSPSYPFAIQASALHGLGVLDSVGAAVLADRLPPAKNPNLSNTFDSSEESWRKALLHEAVHHSLDNTPDISSFSHILGTSTPLGSPRSKRTDLPSRVDTPSNNAKMIQQRIAVQPLIDIQEPRPTNHVRKKSAQSQVLTLKGQNSNLLSPTSTQMSGRPASYFPERVDTPLGPMTPLGPPPRRHFMNTVHSLSQSDLINGHSSSETRDRSMSQGSRYDRLRRTVSSPLLAEGYESLPTRQTVPHRPATAQHPRDSQVTSISFSTIRESYDRVMSESHESDDECGTRASLTLSAVGVRPSLSEYSQSSMSPTTSLFQEVLNRGNFSSSSLNAGPSGFNLDQQNAISDGTTFRYSAMSPPPRMSSSLAHVVLSPPPRSSSLHYFADGQPQIPPVSVSRQNQPDSSESCLQILAPEPTTPPFPQSKSERGSGRSHVPPSLTISTTCTPLAIHSAPGPSSPTSFFDTIQTQPNAMDDLESSSDEDENEADRSGHRVQSIDPRNRTMSSLVPSPRPSFMMLGNFSTPYLRKGESYRPNLLPIGNNPHSKQPRSGSTFRQPFFVDRKHDVLSSTYDFFKYAQEHPLTAASPTSPESSGPRRPSTADHVTVWRNNQRAQESLRKLDGMLIQHMEDEKDTIRRIATTLKQTLPAQISNPIV
jgi:hypothetical protein